MEKIDKVLKLLLESFNTLYAVLRYQRLDTETKNKISNVKKSIREAHDELEEVKSQFKK